MSNKNNKKADDGMAFQLKHTKRSKNKSASF